MSPLACDIPQAPFLMSAVTGGTLMISPRAGKRSRCRGNITGLISASQLSAPQHTTNENSIGRVLEPFFAAEVATSQNDRPVSWLDSLNCSFLYGSGYPPAIACLPRKAKQSKVVCNLLCTYLSYRPLRDKWYDVEWPSSIGMTR